MTEKNEGSFDELFTAVSLYNEKREFLDTLNYFYQKVREEGIKAEEVDPNKVIYTWPEREEIVFEVPKSIGGLEIRLFIEPTPGDSSAIKEIPDLKKTLKEYATLLSKTGHLLVQSNESDEVLSFSYRGSKIIPDSKYAESSPYKERLKSIESARKGINLAFEIYDRSCRIKPNKPNAPRQSFGLM